jgi:electron transfer flavoprotein beta subunit
MKIVVCMKQVPKEGTLKVDQKTNTLVRDPAQTRMNPDDKKALLAALKIKEKTGAQVAALSMGPQSADDVLREALSYGADDAFLITDPLLKGADTYATAYALKCAIQKMGYDHVFTGNSSTDGASGQVGIMLAEFLHVPNIGTVYRIGYDGDGRLLAASEREFGTAFYELSRPCVVSFFMDGESLPLPKPGDIFSAYRERKVTNLSVCDLGLEEVCTNGQLVRTQIAEMVSIEKEAKKEQTVLTDAREASDFLEKMFAEGKKE